VPVNPYALQRRSPSAMMWVALAGPLSNFAMATLVAIPFRLGVVSVFEAQVAIYSPAGNILPSLSQLLYVFIQVNLFLMLFNLIPLAPLDGEKVAQYFFPPSWSRALDTIRPVGPILLLAIAFLGVLNYIIVPPLTLLIRILVG